MSELDYGIYENRLIMTLIDRLYHYLLKRIEAIHTIFTDINRRNLT